MKLTLISYKIASWTLLLGGILHTLSDLLTPETPERTEIIRQMEVLPVQVLGTESNIFSFFQGFSLMMGLLLIGYGAINLFILKNNRQAALPSNILLLNSAICLVGVLVSVKYFFIIPILLTGIPFLGFLISYLAKTNQ